jgi:hypothetical protein
MDKLIKLSMKGKEEFTWSVAVGEEVDGALKECKKSFILFLLFWFSSMSLSLFLVFAVISYWKATVLVWDVSFWRRGHEAMMKNSYC